MVVRLRHGDCNFFALGTKGCGVAVLALIIILVLSHFRAIGLFHNDYFGGWTVTLLRGEVMVWRGRYLYAEDIQPSSTGIWIRDSLTLEQYMAESLTTGNLRQLPFPGGGVGWGISGAYYHMQAAASVWWLVSIPVTISVLTRTRKGKGKSNCFTVLPVRSR